MATLTIGLSGSGVVNGTRNYTISDAHVTRWINAFRAAYQMTGTDAQVLARWADEVVDRTKRLVVEQETKAAAATPIDITPS